MKTTYEVVTYTGRTWENLDNNCFTSKIKADKHLSKWQSVAPDHKHKVICHTAVKGRLVWSGS